MSFDITSTYHPSRFSSRKVGDAAYLDSTNVVRACIREFLDRFPGFIVLKGGRIRHRQDADWLLEQLNRYEAVRMESLSALWHGGMRIQFTYVPSNLDKGFLFYFICEGCEQRAKRLYMPPGQWRYLCRGCHRLHY